MNLEQRKWKIEKRRDELNLGINCNGGEMNLKRPNF
jgi:hypothetical protein